MKPGNVGLYVTVGLALSIGWGIRGNFGHEAGAMIAGTLAAVAVCVLSGREDWRRRVAFFAFFGAVGWGFGGSMSYGQVLSYANSGHLSTQLWGFGSLFVIGFLWGALGGAGTALPAVLDRERLTQLFKPIAFVFGAWWLFDVFAYERLAMSIDSMVPEERRHESLLYWFDADWIPALVALVGVCAFDLWDRRFGCWIWLPILAALGAGVGWVVQLGLHATGLSDWLTSLVLRAEGDPAMWERDQLLINWPQFFPLVSQHLGWAFGMIAGMAAYFVKYGRFRSGASLPLFMAVGWFASFLLFPTLLGVRMTPPRADDWAGILGLFVATIIWLVRNDLRSVARAAVVTGTIGGLGFSGAILIETLMTPFGNPVLTDDPEVIAAWRHWRGANWHSFFEQTYGLFNGLGIAFAMTRLSRQTPPLVESVRMRPWTELFAVSFVLLGVTFLNAVKNVRRWTQPIGRDEFRAVPERMRAPLFESIEFSAYGWFLWAWLLFASAFVVLLVLHRRRAIAILPSDWAGRGQLLFLVFLWLFVTVNFERHLTRFSEGRLITEGAIYANAVLVSVLLLALTRPSRASDHAGASRVSLRRAISFALVVGVVAVSLETAVVRSIYEDQESGHRGKHRRFGEDASWRTRPVIKGKAHE